MGSPRRERRNHIDITPGLVFYHVPEPNPLPKTMPDWVDKVPDGAWTVITKRWCEKMSGGYWEYLVLGPGPVLEWHMMGWIVRVFDPKFEVHE